MSTNFSRVSTSLTEYYETQDNERVAHRCGPFSVKNMKCGEMRQETPFIMSSSDHRSERKTVDSSQTAGRWREAKRKMEGLAVVGWGEIERVDRRVAMGHSASFHVFIRHQWPRRNNNFENKGCDTADA